MVKAITDNRKSRGRPKVGSKLVGVRIDPDLLAKLDSVAAELGLSRPETLRSVFAEWVNSYDDKAVPRRGEKAVMIHLSKIVLEAIDYATGGGERAEFIESMIFSALLDEGLIIKDESGRLSRPDT